MPSRLDVLGHLAERELAERRQILVLKKFSSARSTWRPG